jgi:hypothetical protein
LKETIIMPRVPGTPFTLFLAVALATSFLPDRGVRAGIILAVDDPTRSGVIAYDNGGTLAAFSPASNNPAKANAGNSHSSLRQAGSINFSFETIAGTAGTGGGIDNDSNAFGAIGILIEATAGEAAGTPVLISVLGGGSSLPPGAGRTSLIINNTSYPVNQTNNITGLTVGDQFSFFAGLVGDGNADYLMTGSISVQPAPGGGAPVPEPSSLVLIATGLLPILVVWRLRRNGFAKRDKLIHRRRPAECPGCASGRTGR